jgi:hypothetical protein
MLLKISILLLLYEADDETWSLKNPRDKFKFTKSFICTYPYIMNFTCMDMLGQRSIVKEGTDTVYMLLDFRNSVQ